MALQNQCVAKRDTTTGALSEREVRRRWERVFSEKPLLYTWLLNRKADLLAKEQEKAA